MGQRRKLLDDVSMEELLRLRNEEGLSNYEIAQRVGTSANTIRNHIGIQPKGIKSPYGLQQAERQRRANERAAAAPPAQCSREEAETACLVMEGRIINLIGLTAQYEVRETAGEVIIKRSDGSGFQMKADELDDFVAELNAIRKHLKGPKPMEAW